MEKLIETLLLQNFHSAKSHSHISRLWWESFKPINIPVRLLESRQDFVNMINTTNSE